MKRVILLSVLCVVACERKEEAVAPVTKSAERQAATASGSQQSTALPVPPAPTKVAESIEEREEKIKAYREEIKGMSLEEVVQEIEQLYDRPAEDAYEALTSFNIIKDLFSRLAELDHTKAFAMVEAVKVSLRQHAIPSIYAGWAKRDFEAAYQAVITDLSGRIQKDARQGALASLAEGDPERAFDLVGEIPESDRRNAYVQVMRTWIERDARKALAKVLSAKGKLGGKAGWLLGTISKEHPELVLEALDDAPYLRKQGLSEVAKELHETHPEHFDALYASITDEKERKKLDRIVQFAEFEKNPALMIDHLNSAPNPNVNYHMGKALYEYAKQNWADAWRLKDQIQDDAIRAQVNDYLIGFWALEDPSAALGYTLSHTNRDDLEGATSFTGHSIGSVNQAEHLEQVLAAPQSELTNELISGVFSGWSWLDVEAAAAALPQVDASRYPEVGELYESVAMSYAAAPAEGLAWVQSIADPALQDQAVRGIAGGWATQNESQALDWVNTLPEGNQRDMAVSGVAETMVHQDDADLAMDWISTINSDNYRQERGRSAYRIWLNQDKDAAQQWLEATNLYTPDEKAAFAK